MDLSHDKFFGICKNKCLVEINADSVGASKKGHTHTAEEIGAAPADHTHDANVIATGAVNIENGGTGGTTQVEALTNLGIVDTNTTEFNTSNVDDFVAQVKTYVENNLQVGVPLFFGANNSARGSYGAGFAWSMSPDSKTIFLYNGSTGIRVYNWNTSNGWQKGSLG